MVGIFVKDNFQGQFVDEWKKAFDKESFEKVRKLTDTCISKINDKLLYNLFRVLQAMKNLESHGF